MVRITNILHVDDDEIDIMTVRRGFAKSKSTSALFHAEDGLIALEMLRAGTVPRARRIVLLDVNMPRMSGMEFLKELREDPTLHDTPVIILTTSEEERDRARAYALHVAGYHVKPTGFAAFVELLTTLDHYWELAEMPGALTS